jgi:hypothetical protein
MSDSGEQNKDEKEPERPKVIFAAAKEDALWMKAELARDFEALPAIDWFQDLPNVADAHMLSDSLLFTRE